MPFARGPVLLYLGAGQYKTVGVTEYVGSTDVISIPSDFPTDLASIPRPFWSLLPPNGVWEKAAVLHDFGCVSLAEGTCTLTSRDVDGLFRRVAREGGAGFITRWWLWMGVRWGALANPARRAGWWCDAPAVLAITLTTLAVVVGAVLGVHQAISALLNLI
jgi:hypothetical protein